MSENHPSQGGKDFVRPEDREAFKKFKEEMKMDNDYNKNADKFVDNFVNNFVKKHENLDSIISDINKISGEERKKQERNIPPPIPSDSK